MCIVSGEGTMADLAHNYACELCTHHFAKGEKDRLIFEHTGGSPESMANKQDDLIR